MNSQSNGFGLVNQVVFGQMWCREIKGDKNGVVLPTINEMLDGLIFWICNQDFADQQTSFKEYKEVMEYIKVAMKIKRSNQYMSFNINDENSLTDPYGRVPALIMQLFTMEFGSPPLYAEINRVCRTLDRNYLHTLGAYIRALSVVSR